MSQSKQVAIIGAGIAGATAARELADAGAAVTVFDKSRGTGGRLAGRRFELPGLGKFTLAHGAPYFDARSDDFQAQCEQWLDDGAVTKSPLISAKADAGGKVTISDERPTVYRGTPGMNEPVKRLLNQPAIKLVVNRQITSVRPLDGGWQIGDETGPLGHRFDDVVLTCPVVQTRGLLQQAGEAGDELVAALDGVALEPRWSLLMVTSVGDPLAEADFDEINFESGPIEKIVRGSQWVREAWTFHMSSPWSRQHLELNADDAAERMRAEIQGQLRSQMRLELSTMAGVEDALGGEMLHASAHRWRYGKVSSALEKPCLSSYRSSRGTIGLCGDFCLGGRVEAAWASGRALGRQMAGSQNLE